jgi:hypothetical protein
LEKIGLNKKADIVLLKEVKENEVEAVRKEKIKIETFQGSKQMWAELTENELNGAVKDFADRAIAFKTFMEITVEVMGKGQGYRTTLKVDPKDGLDLTLRKRIMFWKTFMSRGSIKCVLVIQYADKNREEEYVEEDDLSKSFLDNAVENKSKLIIAEYKNFKGDSEDEEGGEFE